PAITATITDVIRVSDVVLVPTRPSPHDLRSVGRTVELVEALGKPLVFIVNAATPRARITTEAAIALSQHGTLAPSIIHQRVDFAASMIDGRTVMELSDTSRSSQEITKLWDYLENRLARNMRPAVLQQDDGLLRSKGQTDTIGAEG
ncbi:MAG: ParA family protein, partial [Alphaproteobacteria bacterium]|nr:ParA family protein [Alphaproteobacteria bacterium]